MPIFAIAARSMPVKSPSDMMVAILPTKSGPTMVSSAPIAASTSAARTAGTLFFIYPEVSASAPLMLAFSPFPAFMR